MVDLILMQQKKGSEELGIHPETSQPVYLLNGTYGPYVQLGEVEEGKAKPKRVTLPKGMKEVDVTMEIALVLLSLPRELGKHPETDGKISVGISRYGSYLVYDSPADGKDYRSLANTDSIIDISMDRALEILSKPKRSRKKTSEPLRELGAHPEDSTPVNIFVGPYGPYVKHNKVNASIPKDTDHTQLTLEQAVELLTVKVTTKPRRGRRKKS